jgi:hypothetical protein
MRIGIERLMRQFVNGDLHADLFFDFSSQTVFKRLARIPFTSWKFPRIPKLGILLSLCNQILSFLANNGCGHFNKQCVVLRRGFVPDLSDTKKGGSPLTAYTAVSMALGIRPLGPFKDRFKDVSHRNHADGLIPSSHQDMANVVLSHGLMRLFEEFLFI